MSEKLGKEELLRALERWKMRLRHHEQGEFDKIFDEPNEQAYNQLKEIIKEYFHTCITIDLGFTQRLLYLVYSLFHLSA